MVIIFMLLTIIDAVFICTGLAITSMGENLTGCLMIISGGLILCMLVLAIVNEVRYRQYGS